MHAVMDECPSHGHHEHSHGHPLGLTDSSPRGLRIGTHVRIEDSSDTRYGAIGRICKLRNSRFGGLNHTALIAFDEVEDHAAIAFKRVALDAYGNHKNLNFIKPMTQYRGA
jgi:hypothetical protein